MAALMGGWVIFMHRSNMERLKNGTENRFSFHRSADATKPKS